MLTETSSIITRAKSSKDYSEIIKNSEEEKYFEAKLGEFDKEKSELEDEKMKTEETVEKWIDKVTEEEGERPDLDKEIDESSEKNASKQKHYDRNMVIFAGGGMAFIAVLLVFSGVCASTDFCIVEIEEKIGDVKTIKKVQNNLPMQILESQFMIVLVGAVIGPVFARILKEKYDIQIEESQITMIMKDAMSTVKMYAKEANKFRDKDGKLEPGSQKKLRDLAFSSMKSNYTIDKYKSMVSNVGVQIFDKAIENAVKEDKIQRLPIEKEQIREIFKQSIDAVPAIIEWQKLDPEVKEKFIQGHIQKLLSNVGVEGWGHKALGEYFDAEVNKRLLAAAVADQKTILSKLDQENRYLKYTSIVADSVSSSLAKPPE